MSADSFHHLVEKSMKRKKNVYDFQDYRNCVQESTANVKVVEMTPSSIKNWRDFKSEQKLKKMGDERPYLNDIKRLIVKKGSYVLLYSLNYDDKEEMKELDFLQKKIKNSGIPNPVSRTDCKGISSVKKSDIIEKLVPLMPKSRHHFWKNLTVSDNSTSDNEIEE